MIPNLIFGILFLRLFFRPHIPVDISFFYFKFSSRMSQRQQKLTKNITHFTIQFHSKNLTHFTHLNSLRNTAQKLFWFYKFLIKLVPVLCQKKHFHFPRTAFLKNFESKYLHISVYLRKNIFVPETS